MGRLVEGVRTLDRDDVTGLDAEAGPAAIGFLRVLTLLVLGTVDLEIRTAVGVVDHVEVAVLVIDDLGDGTADTVRAVAFRDDGSDRRNGNFGFFGDFSVLDDVDVLGLAIAGDDHDGLAERFRLVGVELDGGLTGDTRVGRDGYPVDIVLESLIGNLGDFPGTFGRDGDFSITAGLRQGDIGGRDLDLAEVVVGFLFATHQRSGEGEKRHNAISEFHSSLPLD